ncbi:hypothetical protein ACB272_14610 [Klebsiella pneumoniae]
MAELSLTMYRICSRAADCLHIHAWDDGNSKRALVACQNAQPLPAQRDKVLNMAKRT